MMRGRLALLLGCLLVGAINGFSVNEDARHREAADATLFQAEWRELEGELVSLQKFAVEGMQHALGAPNSTGAAATAAKAKAPSSTLPAAAAKAAPSLEKKVTGMGHMADVAAAMKKKSIGNHAGMMVAKAMLEGMYERAKHKVTELNKHEAESKTDAAKREAAHFEKLKKLESQHNTRHPKLEEHMRNLTQNPRIRNATLLNMTKARWAWMLKEEQQGYENATRSENRDFQYWKKVRDSEHAQFRNLLRMQHATMDRVKTTMKLYDKVLSGNYDKASVQRALDAVKSGIVPNAKDVAFLDAAQVEKFVDQALDEVRAQIGSSAAPGPERAAAPRGGVAVVRNHGSLRNGSVPKP